MKIFEIKTQKVPTLNEIPGSAPDYVDWCKTKRVSVVDPCGLIVNHSHVITIACCDKSCEFLCGLRQIVYV